MIAGLALRRLPKIDLHAHLEGSLSRATLSSLAVRHRLSVPSLRRFAGLAGFLKAFGAVCDLLVDEEDFERAARDVLSRARGDGIAHIEVLFSPQVFLRRGIPLASIMNGLMRARDRESALGGPSCLFILDGVRQWGGDWLEEVVLQAAPWAGRGLAAVGVGGDETALPAREFTRAFRLARSLGLRTTVHAGESGAASSIREALRSLRPDRIGHGAHSVDDASLVAHLARRSVTLELCPSSNVATGSIASWRSHPLRRLFDAGVPVTLNTDDGAFFGTDLMEEMRRASRWQAFEPGDLLRLTRNAARASFLPPSRRRRLESRVVSVWGEALARIRRVAERSAVD